MKIAIGLLVGLLGASFVPAFALYSNPLPPASAPEVTTTTIQQLNSTTKTQKATYNPANVNGLRQDLGKFSVLTSLAAIQWNTTNGDYLQFAPPSLGPTALSNSLIYYNSTETAWQMSSGLNTVAVYVKSSTYSANIFIQANLASAQQVCFGFNSASPIVQQTNSDPKTLQTILAPSIRAGNEVFDWRDILPAYSPSWNGTSAKLCANLPSGLTIIDPLALDSSGQCTNGAGSASCGTTLTTANANDVIIVVGTNFAINISTISSSPSLTWTNRANLNYNTPRLRENEYYSTWSGSGSLTITCTWTDSTTSTGACFAFGISGANTATPFDSHAGLPATGTGTCTTQCSFTATATVSTSNANDFIFGVLVNYCGGVTNQGFSPSAGYTTIIANLGCAAQGRAAFIGGSDQYKVVSVTQSGASVSATDDCSGCGNGNVIYGLHMVDAVQQAAATATQGIKITTANGAPSATITITGCSPSNSTFTANGNTHTYTLTASCQVSLTVPADGSNTRYRWNVSPHPTEGTVAKFQTCASGTCTLYQNTTYYELKNTFTVTPQTPNKWDGGYGTSLVGEIVGAGGTTTCQGGTIATTEGNGGALSICPSGNWADYSTPVSIQGLEFATRLGNTWFAQGNDSFSDTTGGHTHNVNYIQGNSFPVLLLGGIIVGFMLVGLMVAYRRKY